MGSGPEILFEDNHLIAVNKLPSDIVQGDKTGDTPLSEKVALYLKEKYNKPGDAFIGVIHRIDRPVSGIVVFAKTSKALSRMNTLFRENGVQKTYWAVVKQKPEKLSGELIHYLRKHPGKNKSFPQDNEKTGKQAVTHYTYIGKSDNYHFLELQPVTGRHHQIRAQLAAIGCPIKGDIKYGFPRTNTDGSIHLHARKIEFEHPVRKEKMTIMAPMPAHDAIWRKFAELHQLRHTT